ncbi:MAG: hypothetical protein M1816_005433 [Peltula sp. TS41687]|nr:MAG: hypothetical protein M1816_005433 [Peltula sp. TS41687]
MPRGVATEEITGKVKLPLAKVKRIIHQDEDITACSNNAAFAITIATEMFVGYLAQQGHNVVKTERKPRKTIQYKDLANAVFRVDNLEFLSDVIPRTMTFKAYKQKTKKNTKKVSAKRPQNLGGQRTLDGRILGEKDDDSEELEEAGEEEEEEEEENNSELLDVEEEGLNGAAGGMRRGGQVDSRNGAAAKVVMPIRRNTARSSNSAPGNHHHQSESDTDEAMDNGSP